jgi:hypothetical protein
MADFVKGPPIDITGGEDPGDYLERIREGRERDDVDHLKYARDVLAGTYGITVETTDPAVMVGTAAFVAQAHATIAQADLFAERNALLRENVALLREGVALSKASLDLAQVDGSAQHITCDDLPPHIRYGATVDAVDQQWLCEHDGLCGWGDTPAAACAAFDRMWETGSAEEGED